MFVIRRNKLMATTLLDLVSHIMYFHINKSRLVVTSNQDEFARLLFKDFKKLFDDN